jgi:CRP-like cAMP-binding protein
MISDKKLLRPAEEELLPVLNYITQYHKISDRALRYLVPKLQIKDVAKGELLAHAGGRCDYMYFVLKGILRGYINDNKREVTTWITAENELVTSIRSFLMQIPTRENIAAIEDSRVIYLHYDDLQYMYDNFTDFNIMGRKIAEIYYMHAEDRAFICRLSKAADRYNYFMINNGHVINRVPLTYVASYLGIRLDSLSRIRKTLLNKKQAL